MKWPRHWKPWFFENSSLPKWLSLIAPIEINAIILGPLVFSRETMSDTVKRHETIHYQQYLELGIVGFWFVYLWDYFKGYLKYKDGKMAYYNIRFEMEAYRNHLDKKYLRNRKRYCWWHLKEDDDGNDQTNRV